MIKFSINSKELCSALKTAYGAVVKNSMLPVLENALFSVAGGELLITTTDLETTVVTRTDVSSDNDGRFCLPIKPVLDLLKLLPDGSVVLSSDDGRVVLKTTDGKYDLGSVSADEFPQTLSVKGATFSVSSGVLKNAISNTLFATGNDDLRPVLSGVFFDGNFVATDAHRMVVFSPGLGLVDTGFIIPTKPLSILNNILGEGDEVTVTYNDKNASFSFGNVVISCVLVEGKYPDYKAVIPPPSETKLTANRMALLSSARRISIFANNSTHTVKLSLVKDSLVVSSEDPDYENEANESLSCSHTGEDMVIGYNGKFLIDALSNLDGEEVEIELTSPSKGSILRSVGSKEILMLLMPVVLVQ